MDVVLGKTFAPLCDYVIGANGAPAAQLLPGVEGKLTDGMWPNLATHVISSQLSSITRSYQEFTVALTSACCQVRVGFLATKCLHTDLTSQP